MLSEKIKTVNTLSRILRRLKNKGRKIVFTNGCFDILHYGHAKYLEEAKKNGDILIVAVNTDASVRKIKGRGRPVVDEKNRARLVAALGCVDYVTLFSQDTPIQVIKKLKPDILIKGADWNKANIVGAGFVSSYGGKVQTIKLVKGLSTTGIINKIVKKP